MFFLIRFFLVLMLNLCCLLIIINLSLLKIIDFEFRIWVLKIMLILFEFKWFMVFFLFFNEDVSNVFGRWLKCLLKFL